MPKRPIVRVAIFAGVAGVCLALCAVYGVPWLVNKQLRAVFPQARVSIAGYRCTPSSVSFRGIRVVHDRVFDLSVKEACIDFDRDLFSKLSLKEVRLQGVGIAVTQAGKSLYKLADEVHVSPGKSPLIIRSLTLTGLHCAIKSKELNCEGDFSLHADIPAQRIVSFSGTIDQIDGFGVYAENLSIVLPAVQASGQNFAISLVKVGKARFTQVKGNVLLAQGSLSVDPLSAALFGGGVQAAASIGFGRGLAYEASVKVSDLDLEKLARQMELEEKMQLSGTLTGNIAAKGDISRLTLLRGDLVSGLTGGVVKIKDAEVLKGAAAHPAGAPASGSIDPLDIVVENLKDYHYNTGLVKLGLEGGNIVLYANLDSLAQGKRDFTIVLHQAQ